MEVRDVVAREDGPVRAAIDRLLAGRDGDFSKVVTHVRGRFRDQKKRVANQDETLAMLEAGRTLLLQHTSPPLDDPEDPQNPANFIWLTRDAVIAQAGALFGPGFATEGKYRARWELKS